MYNYLNERLNFATKEMMKNIKAENEMKLDGFKMSRLETLDQIRVIEYRIKETKQAIKVLETNIGASKVTIELKQDNKYEPTKETIFSNNIFNGLILEVLDDQLEADKSELNKLVLKFYSEVLE